MTCLSIWRHAYGKAHGNERREGFYMRAAPWECGHARRLRDERGADFVTESAHGSCWWPQKQNAARLQRVGKLRILGCVTPSRPHRLHPCPLRNLLAIEIQIQDHLHRSQIFFSTLLLLKHDQYSTSKAKRISRIIQVRNSVNRRFVIDFVIWSIQL